MAAKGLFINSTEQGFTVRGVANNFFPDNATLAYPANSVILITDESDMATFRSASNYDVLFSALIKDININGERVTKDNIIETFNEAANKPSGGGGNPDAFTNVAYDGKSELKFYNDKGDEVANVDVTPFIKDGMVSNVEILNGNLVITFNTDSGKQPITIPLTDIFNPANYYDKTTADSTFATQVVVNAINTALQSKADKSEIPDTSNFVTKTEYNPKEVAIANALTELNENKADKTELPDVSTLATKSEVEALEPYAIDLDAYVANGITEAQYDEIVQAVSDGRVIKATYETRDYIVESVYVDGDVMKISLSDELKHRFFQFGRSTGTVSPTTAEYVSLVEKGVWNTKANASDVYTKTEIDAMIGNINTILASI